MPKPFLTFLLLVAFASAAFGLAEALDLDTALRDADLVARVKITSLESAPADSGFKDIAHATVIDAAKGPKLNETVKLMSDNGLTCPNVLYEVGDDCIVFAKRLKSGHFETMNAYNGRFRVENGTTVFRPYHRLGLMRIENAKTNEQIQAEVQRYQAELQRKPSAEEIMTDLRRRLSKPPK